MAEHCLYRAEVGAVFNQVSGEGMAHDVRAEWRADLRSRGVAAENFPEPLASEGAAAMIEE